MRKEVNEIISELVEEGWSLRKGKRHYVLCHPVTRKTVTISATPSDFRALHKIRKTIRAASRVD